MKLVVDMNLTPRWIEFLRSADFESAHWSDIGDPRATDRSITDWARINGYVILTNDMDFPQILAYTQANAPSVVLLRGAPLTPEARGVALLLALRHFDAELATGAIVTIDWTSKLRVRMLPLS
jgi:predicted nuclease of predicted toxin-antitoxin system